MKATRLCEAGDSGRYIPADLWPGILCRLPVKPLLRFRCVSKSWLSLIKDPEFARLHLKTFKNNRDETHLLVVQDNTQNVVVRRSDTFEINSETLLALEQANRERSWDFVCSIDGLVMLKNSPRSAAGTTRFRDLKVWNPSLRKFHELPPLPEITRSPGDGFYTDAEIGLGYDPLAKTYKHVRLIIRKPSTVHSVAIYNLGTGSWKISRFQGKGCSGHWHHESFEHGKRVCVGGSLYVLVRYRFQEHKLGAFDLSREVFSSIRLPGDPNFTGHVGFGRWSELVLSDHGCSSSVALLGTRYRSHSISLWILETSSSGSMYWTERYSCRWNSLDPILHLKKNGDVLIERLCCEMQKWVLWGQVASYRPETDEYRTLDEVKGYIHLIRCVTAYVESLILL